MAGQYGAQKSARFTADGSFGSTAGVIISSYVVNLKSTVRAIAHIRSGSVAGGIVVPADLQGGSAQRRAAYYYFGEPGLAVGARGLVEVSGASTVATVYFRNI